MKEILLKRLVGTVNWTLFSSLLDLIRNPRNRYVKSFLEIAVQYKHRTFFRFQVWSHKNIAIKLLQCEHCAGNKYLSIGLCKSR